MVEPSVSPAAPAVMDALFIRAESKQGRSLCRELLERSDGAWEVPVSPW